jgi:hypothetical protein
MGRDESQRRKGFQKPVGLLAECYRSQDGLRDYSKIFL